MQYKSNLTEEMVILFFFNFSIFTKLQFNTMSGFDLTTRKLQSTLPAMRPLGHAARTLFASKCLFK
jgi:hypothetical protein